MTFFTRIRTAGLAFAAMTATPALAAQPPLELPGLSAGSVPESQPAEEIPMPTDRNGRRSWESVRDQLSAIPVPAPGPAGGIPAMSTNAIPVLPSETAPRMTGPQAPCLTDTGPQPANSFCDPQAWGIWNGTIIGPQGRSETRDTTANPARTVPWPNGTRPRI